MLTMSIKLSNQASNCIYYNLKCKSSKKHSKLIKTTLVKNISGRKNLHSCGWSITTTRMPLTRFWPLAFEGHSTTISLQTYQINITEYIDWKDTFHSCNTQHIDAFNHAWTTNTLRSIHHVSFYHDIVPNLWSLPHVACIPLQPPWAQLTFILAPTNGHLC
jgi:hypothetical protein